VSAGANATARTGVAEGAPLARPPAPAAASAGNTRPRVVIVGGGFGGLRAARALGDAPVDIVLVDRHNYHLFQPLLYQVATAGLEPEQIARPVRAVLRRLRNFEFRMTEVTGLDASGKRIVTTEGPIAYDYLILAVGGQTNYFGLEGVMRHGFGLKDVPEAIRIRNHVLRAFERAMLEPDPERRRAWLTFVVVGGGPTGVEMAGALSELIRLVLVKDYPRLNVKDVRVLLLEATDRLLGPMPARLREAAAETLWRKKHVEVRFGATVADYDGERVSLKSGEVIPARTLIWAAGVQAVSLTARLGLPTVRQGRVAVTPTLDVPDHPDIYVIGDAAYLEVDGAPLPMMAPVAIQMARTAAANIRRRLAGQPPAPFDYRDPGSLATIGRNAAVAYIRGIGFTGFPAWVVWLVVHIIQLIGFRNKLFVLLNWAWDYFFYERAARLITTMD
jgi:NADH:quinone reductase (non-electrogenic)